MPYCPYVQGQRLLLLRGRGYREGMPLEVRYGRYVQVDVVPGLKGEVGGPLDDEVDHPGGQYHPRGDVALSLVRQGVVEADGLLDDEEAAGAHEPLPEVGGVEQHQQPEYQVQEVRPVEDLVIDNNVSKIPLNISFSRYKVHIVLYLLSIYLFWRLFCPYYSKI